MQIIYKTILVFGLIYTFTLTNFLYAAPDLDPEQLEMLKSLPADQRESIMAKMDTANALGKEIEEVFEEESTLIEKPEIENIGESDCDDCIYGYDFFKYSPSTFVQTSSSPVPSDYLLGPGDKLEINYYGTENISEETYIKRNGNVVLPKIGPVSLAGLTFSEAKNLMENKVESTLIGTNISVSITELRSISVYLLGEAYKPGLYTMSALSSISNALFVAGGVYQQGSLRNIEIRRDNEIIGNYDFYDFLLKGIIDNETRLQDGDIIFVPFIENTVEIGGAFKRPATYEFLAGETIEDAINLAGGFDFNVPPSAKIEISSINKRDFNREISFLENSKQSVERELNNGDSINISFSPDAYSRTITLSGEFKKPGVYSFKQGEKILDIINRAGGYSKEAYVQGALFFRESVAISQKEGFERSADSLEQTIVDIITMGASQIGGEASLAPLSRLIQRLREAKPLGRLVVDLEFLRLKTNPISNFKLQDGDKIHIPSRPNSVSVVGEVLNSSTQSFDPELGAFQYIDLAGGLNNTADKDKIFIILPNGQSKILKRSLFSSKNYVLPGSTIVVSRSTRTIDGISLTQIITPILADLATSAAAIAAISD
ncbi:MAG: hypothetical protein CMD22_00020 [Flavobacteriales bacterium]|nr:hypothetical protein [Flavobacteriales bacterium]